RAAQLAELHGLRAQLDLGVEPRQIEQIGGETAQPPRLDASSRKQSPCLIEIGPSAVEVVVEQLEHPVERGQRRAQLVRGRRDEGTPSLLLAQQLSLHDRERAG